MLFIRLCIFTTLFLFSHRVKATSTQPSRLLKIETIKDPIITLHGNKRSLLTHSDSFLLEFTAFERVISINLEPNRDLFHPEATVTIFNTNGSTNETKSLLPHDHFVYKGLVNDHSDHWARIIMRTDLDIYPIFEGAFTIDSDIYHIKTTPNYHLSKRLDDPMSGGHMVIYRDSDQQVNTLEKRRAKSMDIMCAMEELAYNRRMAGSHAAPSNNLTGTSFSGLWDKRDVLDISLPRVTSTTTGCPTARKIAYMGAAADCSYVLSYGSIRYAKIQMINDWNVASAVYERTFNVSLGLIYLQISVPECPPKPKPMIAWNQVCSNFYTINDRLSDFSLWRGKKGDDGAALWHLMTKCSTGVKVGIAWLSQLCETQVSQQIEDDGSYEWVSGTGVSSITRDEWKVVAHEIGHGFGAIHDCTSHMCPCKGECGCCPLSDTVCSAGDTYLMNPTSNVTTNDFSPCSVSDICNTFPNIGYCLKSPDLRTGGTFSLCGNGILEPGEECDPGLTDSPCCFAKTCKLKPNAVCDDYSNQCCLNCDIAPENTVCRPAVSECDSTEYCTGKNSSCPADIYDQDGSSCANGMMKCASGICTSRDQQCMARGLRQNISEQCSFQQDSCLISCTDPKDARNCLMLSGMFLDGTECGLAGFCEKGECISTGALNTIKAWTAKNKAIAIPVYLFGSIGVILIIGWTIWFFRRRYKKKILLGEKDKDSRPTSLIDYRKDDPFVLTKQIPTVSHDNTIVPVVSNENIELDNLSSSEHNSNHSSSNNSRRGGNTFIPNNNETVNSLGTHRRGKSFGYTF
ncbi:Metallo-peptidase family M12-domain-containing protein [Thamnidium elegans]|nr:Metallo-peptidase family M12-domain-containing protein [Thamnidium elegans]